MVQYRAIVTIANQ